MNYNEQMQYAISSMLNKTKKCVEEYTKFFTAAYTVETNPYCPIPVNVYFEGINVPDIRKPGNSLTDLYPHYLVRVLDPKDPRYESHMPGSREFMTEQAELHQLIKTMRARQEEMNERSRKKCEELQMEVI